MKKSSNFEPIYLQDAKRHIDWLYKRVKKTSEEDSKNEHIKRPSFFSKFLIFLKKLF